jgi:hypothetical protein
VKTYPKTVLHFVGRKPKAIAKPTKTGLGEWWSSLLGEPVLPESGDGPFLTGEQRIRQQLRADKHHRIALPTKPLGVGYGQRVRNARTALGRDRRHRTALVFSDEARS